jgi:flagellar hook-associated protein 3 FlgL
VQINQLGPDVYGPAGADLFVTLSDISTKLRTVPSTLTGTDLTTIDTAVKRLSAAQAAEGASYNRVQAAQAAQTPITLALTSELSDIQDIDLAAQAVAVSTANVTYQAALQTTANIRQTSLLDFLN